MKNIEEFVIRNVEDIPIGEKIDAFDKFYLLAVDHFNKMVSTDYEEDNDDSEYFYEAVITGLLGPMVWDVIQAAHI